MQPDVAASSVAEPIAAAKAILADLEAQIEPLELAEAENRPGAQKALNNLRAAISAAKSDLDEKVAAGGPDEPAERVLLPPPIPPRAPAVRVQVDLAKAALDALEARTRYFKLRDAEGQPGARGELKQHQAAVDAAREEYELLRDALEEAIDCDRRTVADRSAAIRAMDPADLVEGITREKCCAGCSPDGGCLLVAGINRCAHPLKGALPPELSGDRDLRGLQAAATDELIRQANALLSDDEEEWDEDDEDDEDEGDDESEEEIEE